jgi:hypothetical protein
MGQLELRNVTAANLNALYGDLLETGRSNGRGLSPKSVANVHLLMHKALADAVRWEKIPKTPRIELNLLV